MDGIDVALVETDGQAVVRVLGGGEEVFPVGLRGQLEMVLEDPKSHAAQPLVDLENAVTDAFGDAVRSFCERSGFLLEDIDLVGCHGQTIWHDPANRVTRQLNDGPRLASMLGVDVVDDFRRADVQAGGEGAPFAPLYHQVLVRDLAEPVAVLNLGGVGNVSFVNGDEVHAFDTGPASALIDDFVRKRFDRPFDKDGALARQGKVDEAVVARFLEHDYFSRPAPKSLDRQQFHAVMGEVKALESPLDAVATLTELTARSVLKALDLAPQHPAQWLVCGGGRANLFLLERLRALLEVPVRPIEAVGHDGDLLEAACFGYLAVRSVKGLPLSLPTTTGVPRPLTGGRLSRG